MVKQILLPILAVMAFIVVIGLYTQGKLNFLFSGNSPTQTQQPKTVKIGNKTVNVELANTSSLRQKGLGDRKLLDQDSGMLFVFDSKPVSTSFWMKGMLIPIDIIWIKDGKILKIDKNVQPAPTNTSDKNLTLYTAGEPIDYVLEVNAGFCDKNNIRVGDSVDVSKI